MTAGGAGGSPATRSRADGNPGVSTVGCIVVAAGSGTRLGAAVPKAFVLLQGRSLLGHAVAGLRAAVMPEGSSAVTHLVVVAPSDHQAEASAIAVAEWPGDRPPPVVVIGGSDRVESVRRGLRALPDGVDIVLVHDAARCLTPPGLHAAVAATVRSGHDAVVPGVPVVDTVKTVDPGEGPPWRVLTTTPREALRAVQTPQGFRREVLEQAHRAAVAAADGGGVTDDAGLVEAIGGTVWVIPGDPHALKVTTAADLDLAERIVAGRDREPVDGQ